jgi:hypothetical protein
MTARPAFYLALAVALLMLAGCTPAALVSDGDDWDEQCRNPVTGEGYGVPIYGTDC